MSIQKLSRYEKISDHLHSATIHLLRRIRKSDDDIGLSAPRLSALSVLVYAGEKTLTELSQIEQVKPPAMTKLIQALEADGLVARKTDPHDKRAIRLRPTAKGRRILQKARRLRIRDLTSLLQSLNPEEIATLDKASRIMEKIATHH